MANKRRRQISGDNQTKTKRAKFTLESVNLPTTTTEGVVLVTGAGDVGQLGLGPDVLEKSRPALVELNHIVVDICAGGMHTVCLTKEGKVLTFGCNDEGALGRVTDGKEDAEFEAGEVELPAKVIQVSAGDSHTAALLEDGRVFAWGTFRDSHGNMGMTSSGNEKLPYEIIKDNIIIKIASGADHIVFLTNHGDVYTCGCAEQGQLGRTSERGSSRNARNGIGKGQIAKLLHPSPISLKPSLKLHFDNIWAGTYGTFCKVANSTDIYVFGLNNYNQLGLKSQNPHFMPTLSKEFSKYKWNLISSGQHHSIGLDEDGKVYAIGRKDYGRLGLGEGCMDAEEIQLISTLEDKKIKNVACGSATSFAVTEDGDLYGWGMGTNGQLGTGEEDDLEVPTLIKSKQLQDRKVFRVSSGGQHTVILAISNSNNNQGDCI
nr:regulator of chromosome condensation isoform X1 [Leptinotarsa decemlineata]XP_023017407.1 regulator of chromosome condensation isoform X1 [Leptinotarsa decemlineata]